MHIVLRSTLPPPIAKKEVLYTETAFASSPAHDLVVRLTADTRGALAFSAGFCSELRYTTAALADGIAIYCKGKRIK